MFNLKRHKLEKIAQIKAMDKMLQDNNEKDGNTTLENTGNYDWLLKDVRKEPEGDRNYEKLLSEVRTNEEGQVITDKALDNRDGETYIPMRDDNPVPIMDVAKKGEKEELELYKGGQDKKVDLNTAFWDDFVGKQLIGRDPIKIVNNDQRSQLLENYDSREDFRKANPSMKKSAQEVLGTMKDADALLYHIYRLAATESRKVTEQEQQMVDDVNSAKIRLLAATTEDVAADDEYRADQSDIVGDEEDEKEKNKEETEEEMKDCPCSK